MLSSRYKVFGSLFPSAEFVLYNFYDYYLCCIIIFCQILMFQNELLGIVHTKQKTVIIYSTISPFKATFDNT